MGNFTPSSVRTIVQYLVPSSSVDYINKALDEEYHVSKYVNDTLHFDISAMNYAVVGRAGTGKSQFENALVGEYLCETGVNETTTVDTICKVTVPDLPDVFFYDFPGYDTNAIQKNTYIREFGLPLFRGIFVVASSRFYESDAKLFHDLRRSLQELKVKGAKKQLDKAGKQLQLEHVPVYIVYTKFDLDLEAQIKKHCIQQYSKHKCRVTKHEFDTLWHNVLRDIRGGVSKELQHRFNDTHVVRTIVNKYLFILSADFENILLTRHPGQDIVDDGWVKMKKRVLYDPSHFASPEERLDLEDTILNNINSMIRTSRAQGDYTRAAVYEEYVASSPNMFVLSLSILVGVVIIFVFYLWTRKKKRKPTVHDYESDEQLICEPNTGESTIMYR